MKTKILRATLILILAGLSGCATQVSPDSLQFVSVDGQRYMSLPMPIDSLQVGQMVAFRRAGVLTAGPILSVRSAGVYRVAGPDLALVSSSNYVGQLFAVTP